jgi:transcriptional regulator with XRE-family HTH domain
MTVMMIPESRYRSTNLAEVIRQQGRFQKWLAGQIGVSESLISKVILGQRTLRRRDAEHVAQLLGVPFFVLFELHKGDEVITETHETEVEESNAAD